MNGKRRMLAKSFLVMVGFMFALGGSAAFAEGSGSCASDVEQYCKQAGSDKKAIAQCLKQHESDLSNGCKEQIAAVKQKVLDFAEACKADAEKLCKGVKRGGGRIMQCLQQHEAELSADCKTKMAPGM